MFDSCRAVARVRGPLGGALVRALSSLFVSASLGCAPSPDVSVSVVRPDAGTRPLADASVAVDAPVAIDAGVDASCGEACRPVSLALGEGFSCALGADGSVRCWGRGEDGELGDGARRHSPGCRRDEDCAAAPVRVAFAGRARAIDASGGPGACLVDDEGAAHCWGLDPFFSPTAVDVRLAPRRLETGGAAVASVAHGVWLLCAISEDDGLVRCQGRNDLGQLGRGAFSPPARTLMPVLRADGAPLSGAREVRVGMGGRFACAVAGESVWCWGVGDRGELGEDAGDRVSCGDGLARATCATRAVRVAGVDGAELVQLGLGLAHACALLVDGRVRCWGDGSMGALGRGDRAASAVPEHVPGLEGVVQLAVGAEHACALLESGKIACWGANGSGQLGDGVGDHPGAVCEARRTAYDCSDLPVLVAGIDDATVIAAGAAHACAIRARGEVVCWGEGATMQLGDGERAPRFVPVAVRGL